jgi:hypothetical protein
VSAANGLEDPAAPGNFVRMKRYLALGTLLVLSAFGADDFWAQLTPEERAAAGVADLTPGQREALDRLADRFATEGARKAAEVAKAEIKQQKAAKVGFTSRDDGEEVVRTRINGTFHGWEGNTLFRFENGQVWQQTGSGDRFAVAAMDNPAAELRPSRLGGWKLFVASVDRWVRVKRVR